MLGSKVLMLCTMMLGGMIASEPNAKEKGVSLVAHLLVVQYAHKHPGSSFGHFLFLSVRDFLRQLRIVLFDVWRPFFVLTLAYSVMVPIRTVNRQCSSGLEAVADVAASIKAGYYDIMDLIFILNTGIAAGLESTRLINLTDSVKLTLKWISLHKPTTAFLLWALLLKMLPNVMVESHRHAAAASASGKFKDEIVPVSTKISIKMFPIVYPNTGEERPVTISVDNGIRPNTNMNDSAKLKPAFKRDGSTTAGNASQVSDDAGAVLLMKRSLTMQKGLPILGVFGSFAAIGVDPAVMGVGPAAAIPVAVKSAGLELDDIDLFEINEAFASQYVSCCKKLELDPEKVNANGGAIALGGATGARCVATLLNEMKRRGRDHSFGVTSMCIGSGMEAAAVFERGDSVDELCNARTTAGMSRPTATLPEPSNKIFAVWTQNELEYTCFTFQTRILNLGLVRSS
ncbi:hypothetical protein DVH24_028644 [Malus domestica]|uniref:Thiolase C-terminal domain-containing protein n=1 Tax=Malus domestica TaxID=3750 RepID=A0A498IYD3_MALDO|nr:hypothetical protein DVH24_028644 [Malus domestica]